MDALGFFTLSVTGFVACAEFGSYDFVHPVIRRLPAREHVPVEQGLLTTFGRVRPAGMTLCLALATANAAWMMMVDFLVAGAWLGARRGG